MILKIVAALLIIPTISAICSIVVVLLKKVGIGFGNLAKLIVFSIPLVYLITSKGISLIDLSSNLVFYSALFTIMLVIIYHSSFKLMEKWLHSISIPDSPRDSTLPVASPLNTRSQTLGDSISKERAIIDNEIPDYSIDQSLQFFRWLNQHIERIEM